MPHQPGSLKEVFLAALDVPASTREHWLLETCGADDHLRQRVEALLEAHDNPQDLFRLVGFPSVSLLEADPTGPRYQPGALVGAYRLIEQIGEGGMGTVWKAAQLKPVQRLVAIKILQAGFDCQPVVDRFHAELRTLAVMDHPNIARLLDAGRTSQGWPYLVMELVAGQPITTYCDAARLPLRARLELFVTLCKAVQHAHLKGVIHRDLKPGNVLVGLCDGTPVAKVIDFGIALNIQPALPMGPRMTRVGSVIGTPAYMSPEQATLNNLDIDTRSDIYALGILLYELLTGTPPLLIEPLSSRPLLEVLKQVREHESVRPSVRVAALANLPQAAHARGTEPDQLKRSLRGDLDWIAQKALEKDRNRRYQTASELAADVERYLTNEPVHASPPRLTYRMGKLVRRNRGRVLVGSLLLAITLAMATGYVWILRERAAAQADAALQQADRVRRATAQVEALLAEARGQLGDQHGAAALEAARRAEALLAGGDVEPGAQQQVQELLRQLRFVVQLDHARQRALVWKENGFDHSGSLLAYTQAFRDQGFDVDAAPEDSRDAFCRTHQPMSRLLAGALDHWALLLWLANPSHADPIRLRADLANRLDPHPLRGRVRAAWLLTSRSALREELSHLVGSDVVDRAQASDVVLLAAMLPRVGLHSLQLPLLEQAQRRAPGDFWINLELASALRAAGKAAEEMQFARAAVALRPDSTAALNNLGCALLERRHLDEAADTLRRAIVLDPRAHLLVRNLGRVLMAAHQIDEAIACFRQAHDLAPTDPAALNHLAGALERQGKPQAARDTLLDALALEPGNPSLHCNLGKLQRTLRQPVEARISYDKALALDSNLVLAHQGLGDLCLEQNQPAEATRHYQKALTLDPRSSTLHNHLAIAYSLLGKSAEALANWRSAVELNPADSMAQRNLGKALLDQNDVAGALAALKKAVEARPNYADAWYLLGNAYHGQGKSADAITAYRRVLEADAKHSFARTNLAALLMDQRQHAEGTRLFRQVADDQPTLASAHLNLGNALIMQQQWAEGVTRLRRAVELAPRDPAILTPLVQALLSWPNASPRDLQGALDLARQAVTLRPDEVNLELLAFAALQHEQWAEALKARRQLARLRPPTAVDCYLLAVTHLRAGQGHDALLWFARANRESETSPQADPRLAAARQEASALLAPARAAVLQAQEKPTPPTLKQ
ncbi:MAG: tetratricopeptide repeat protein [Gemmataceae bacterium]